MRWSGWGEVGFCQVENFDHLSNQHFMRGGHF